VVVLGATVIVGVVTIVLGTDVVVVVVFGAVVVVVFGVVVTVGLLYVVVVVFVGVFVVVVTVVGVIFTVVFPVVSVNPIIFHLQINILFSCSIYLGLFSTTELYVIIENTKPVISSTNALT
jgi:hypothetical protein